MEKPPEVKPVEKPVEKIYWAPAKNYALHLSKKDPYLVGPYQREKRDNSGGLLQQAIPITFGNNTFATDDPELQKVIEGSEAFQNGEIIHCENMDVANAMTQAKRDEKAIMSGMVSMTDEAGTIRSAEDAQAEMGKFKVVS